MPQKMHQDETTLYQTLTQGIENEEILNIKYYSNEDLRNIIDCQDKLLNETNNATAFESIHENSISDLKKFTHEQLNISSDSYETMREFIRIFGTNYKGELTPEGKAAQDRLNLLIKAKKQKILQHKAEILQKKQNVKPQISKTETPQPRKEKIVIKQSKTDDILDQIINGNSDNLKQKDIYKALGTKTRPTPRQPNKSQPQSTISAPIQAPQRNIFRKIKTWAIITTVAMSSYLGLKSNKSQSAAAEQPAPIEDIKSCLLANDSLQQPHVKQKIDTLTNAIKVQHNNGNVDQTPKTNSFRRKKQAQADHKKEELAMGNISNDYQYLRNILLSQQHSRTN